MSAPAPDPDTIRAAILARMAELRPETSFCPSEVARGLAEEWRPLMPAIRDEARALQQQGRLSITQKGAPVESWPPRGPIRLTRP